MSFHDAIDYGLSALRPSRARVTVGAAAQQGNLGVVVVCVGIAGGMVYLAKREGDKQDELAKKAAASARP